MSGVIFRAGRQTGAQTVGGGVPEDFIKRTDPTLIPAVSDAAGVPAPDPADTLKALADDMRDLKRRAAEAADAEALLGPSRDIAACAVALRRVGMNVRFISRFVATANRRLFSRLFALTAPPGWETDACLIVMGSEGRGEQILKTDQDNGVIFRDGVSPPDWSAALADFSRRLGALGFPPCPGGVMAVNAEWAQPQAAYRRSLSSWLRSPDDAAALRLAILADAAAVAGDAGLLAGVRRDLLAGARDNPGFLHHFAKPALAFDATRRPRLAALLGHRPPPIDLKKTALFPIVHGARTLALEAGLDVVHTADRLEALAARRSLDPGLARDAADAFFFVSSQRLDAAIGTNETTEARRAELDVRLATVKRFKAELARRFRLDA